MSPIPADELDAMRATAEAEFPTTCVIGKHAGNVSDGAGGHSQSWTPQAARACRLSPAAADQAGGGERDGGSSERVLDRTTHILTLSAGADITEADRVTADGQVYEVTLVKRRPGIEITRRVELREADG